MSKNDFVTNICQLINANELSMFVDLISEQGIYGSGFIKNQLLTIHDCQEIKLCLDKHFFTINAEDEFQFFLKAFNYNPSFGTGLYEVQRVLQLFFYERFLGNV